MSFKLDPSTSRENPSSYGLGGGVGVAPHRSSSSSSPSSSSSSSISRAPSPDPDISEAEEGSSCFRCLSYPFNLLLECLKSLGEWVISLFTAAEEPFSLDVEMEKPYGNAIIGKGLKFMEDLSRDLPSNGVLLLSVNNGKVVGHQDFKFIGDFCASLQDSTREVVLASLRKDLENAILQQDMESNKDIKFSFAYFYPESGGIWFYQSQEFLLDAAEKQTSMHIHTPMEWSLEDSVADWFSKNPQAFDNKLRGMIDLEAMPQSTGNSSEPPQSSSSSSSSSRISSFPPSALPRQAPQSRLEQEKRKLHGPFIVTAGERALTEMNTFLTGRGKPTISRGVLVFSVKSGMSSSPFFFKAQLFDQAKWDEALFEFREQFAASHRVLTTYQNLEGLISVVYRDSKGKLKYLQTVPFRGLLPPLLARKDIFDYDTRRLASLGSTTPNENRDLEAAVEMLSKGDAE